MSFPFLPVIIEDSISKQAPQQDFEQGAFVEFIKASCQHSLNDTRVFCNNDIFPHDAKVDSVAVQFVEEIGNGFTCIAILEVLAHSGFKRHR